jgi:eukaryotic-like serine/threonine-protein kinase
MIGRVVSHYRVLSVLGGGGMGVVYEAEDSRLRRRVALKFLPEDALATPGRLQRFRREAEAASALNHPHICTIYDIGEHEGQPFIVMEKLEGETLAQLIAKNRLPLNRALQFGADLADALAAAHVAGIIHRDIKPANIFVTARGQVKLLDFGLARLESGEPVDIVSNAPTAEASPLISIPGTTVGTLSYMSPEQARGETVDHRSDIFSLGIVIYEMLTGRSPFEGSTVAVLVDAILNRAVDPPSTIRRTIPAAVDQLVLASLEKERDLRVQSAAELRANLQRIIRDTSGSGTAGIPATRAPLRLRKWIPIAAVAAVLMAILLGGIMAARGGSASRPAQGGAPESPAVRTPMSPAQEALVRGRYFAGRGILNRAIAAYEDAVKLDPTYAEAWGELGRAYALQLYIEGSGSDAGEKAFLAIEKALQLDPRRAETYVARGDLLWTRANGFQHREALRDYRRAIDLNPGLGAAHGSMARVLVHVGLMEESRREVVRALELEPDNVILRIGAAWGLVYSRRCEEAVEEFQRLEIEAEDMSMLAIAVDCTGRTQEAISLAEQAVRQNKHPEWLSMSWAAVALLRAKSGDRARADSAIQEAIATSPRASHFHHTCHFLAVTYALLGDRDRAIDWLERTVREGFPALEVFVADPNLASIRGDARFRALARRIEAEQRELKAILR